MADSFIPSAGAQLIATGGQPRFLQGLTFVPTTGLPLNLSGGQPSFITEQFFRPANGMELRAELGQPSFNQPDLFVANPLRLQLGGGQPQFTMPDLAQLGGLALAVGGGQPTFHQDGGEISVQLGPIVLVVSGGQPTFAERPLEPQRFIPSTGLTLAVSGGQPRFVGGDRRIGAPPVFPFKWADGDEFVERYGYAAGVKSFHDANEQREQLRAVPGGSIRFGTAHLTARESQQARALLSRPRNEGLIVPWWPYACAATAAVTLGAGSVLANLRDVPLVAEQWVVLWSSPTDIELNVVADFGDDELVLLYPTAKARKAHSFQVVPAVVGRFTDSEPFTWKSRDVAAHAHEFGVERWRP